MPLAAPTEEVWTQPPSALSYKGSASVATINGLSPTILDCYVLSSAGTLTAGSLSVAVGDVVEYSGTAWVKLHANVGGFVPANVLLTVAASGLLSPLTSSADEGKLAEFDGISNTPAEKRVPTAGSIMHLSGLSVSVGRGFVFATGGVGAGTWSRWNQVLTSPLPTLSFSGATHAQTVEVHSGFFLGGFYPFTSRTSAPGATNQIPVNDTSEGFWAVGTGIKFTQAGVAKYGVITAVTANTSVTFAGRAATVAVAIDDFSLAQTSKMFTQAWKINGVYGTAGASKLLANNNQYVVWSGPPAYIVDFVVRHVTNDTTVNPRVNVTVNGGNVSSVSANQGPQPNAAGFSASNGININAGAYLIQPGDVFEIACPVGGGTGNAANLSVIITYLIP